MSRTASRVPSAPIRFPRVSGDEPWIDKVNDAGYAFSPRERG